MDFQGSAPLGLFRYCEEEKLDEISMVEAVELPQWLEECRVSR